MKHTHIHSYKVENLIQNLHIPRRKAKNKLDGHISAGETIWKNNDFILTYCIQGTFKNIIMSNGNKKVTA